MRTRPARTRNGRAFWHHPRMSPPLPRPCSQSRSAARRQALHALALGLTLPGLLRPAQAGFNFFTSEYTASRAELERELGKQFPQQRGYGALFTVVLRDPQLGLDAAANRVQLGMALTLGSVLLQPAELPGRVVLSSALRYDASTLSLRLEQPRAEQLQLAGVTGADADHLQRVAAVVAQEALQDQALHTFRREDLTVGRKTYEIGAITVLADGLKVQLL